MNKKGFTLVELITSFALASVIMIFIFNIVVLLKNNYISKSVRTDLMIKQSLLSQKLNEDFTNNNIKNIVTCDSVKKCYEITLADDTTKRLTISEDDKTITYGDYVYELTQSSYTNKINVNIKTTTLTDLTLNDSLLVIDIPIYNKKYTDTNFGVKVIYQFNSNVSSIGTGGIAMLPYQIGDYVYMTPAGDTFLIDTDITGGSGEQYFNPQELNLWRVISINKNGTVDMVSEYVSSSAVSFSGTEGYRNFVGYLNVIASHYANPQYTSKTRYMGYDGQTEYLTNYNGNDNYRYSRGWGSSTSNNDNEALGGGDIMFQKDTNLVKTAVGTLKAKNVTTGGYEGYWIASRYYSIYNAAGCGGYDGCGRFVNTLNSVDSRSLRHVTGCYSGDNEYYFSVRPIVTLKPSAQPTGGNGSAESPYTLD